MAPPISQPKTQKLTIRLLRDGLEPEDALRQDIVLDDWPKISGARVVFGTMGGNTPKWARFLNLENEVQTDLYNRIAYGLVFISVKQRWFLVSFGMGHVKLDLTKFEQNFGLRIVLNTVDPKQLRSADLRTPDDNTLTRRSQASRGADQTIFAIDVERDILRGLAGIPKQNEFASFVSGSDALSMDRKIGVDGLSQVCTEVYVAYRKNDYKENFGWIDHILHVREPELIKQLETELVGALDMAVKGEANDDLHLAYPRVYDPEKVNFFRYKGFRSRDQYPDLDISGYLDALQKREINEYLLGDLSSHTVHEVDDAGRDCGNTWKISECLGFEIAIDGHRYVLSGGLWYEIDIGLVNEVQNFFNRVSHIDLPPAKVGENEETYNQRLATHNEDILCLDRKLIKPTGATSMIEVCDFIDRNKHLIHVKDKTSSSRLSHLFNQGTVSARILKVDGLSRDMAREKIKEVETERGLDGYSSILPSSNETFHSDEFTVVYAVLTSGKKKLPFFSLVTFRRAARDLEALGYKFAFSWIEKSANA